MNVRAGFVWWVVSFGVLSCAWADEIVEPETLPIQELIFPTVVSTDSREEVFLNTTLVFMNLSNTAAQLELTAFANGEPVPVFGSPPQKSTRILKMTPNGADQITLWQEEDEDGESAFVNGWILVRADKDLNVQGSSELRRIEEVGIVSDTQLPAMKPAQKFQVFTTLVWVCNTGQRGITSMSGLAFVNPSSEDSTQVQLTLHTDLDGDREDLETVEQTLELPPLGREALFLSELFPEIDPDHEEIACLATGTVVEFNLVLDVTSDLPIAVSALDFDLSTGQFVALPVSTESD